MQEKSAEEEEDEETRINGNTKYSQLNPLGAT
jgi:hypothetical protein